MSQASSSQSVNSVATADASTTFISYSRDDSSFVMALARDLKAAGADVWLDQMDISPGQRWDLAIQQALTNCARLIVVLSPSSVASTTVLDEASFVLDNHKPVIPVLYRDCEVPFRLGRVQYVDFQGDYSRGFDGLLRTMKAPLREAATSPKPKLAASSYRSRSSPTLDLDLPQKTKSPNRSPFLTGPPAAAKASAGAAVFLVLAAALWFSSLAHRNPSANVQASVKPPASVNVDQAGPGNQTTNETGGAQKSNNSVKLPYVGHGATEVKKPESNPVDSVEYQQLTTRLVQTEEEAKAASGFWVPIKADLNRSGQSLRPEIQTALVVLNQNTNDAGRSLQTGNLTAARTSLDSADQQIRILQRYQNE